MDTSKIENQAEDYLFSQLSKFGFLASKPKYDVWGGDILVVDDSKYPSKMIRVQSKGRTMKSKTSVTIPNTYLSEDFVLFVCIYDPDEHLLMFSPKDLKELSNDGDKLVINFTKGTYRLKYQKFLFDEKSVRYLKALLRINKIKKETSLIIDSFCLDNGIKNTHHIYSSLYPEKKLKLFSDPLELIKTIIRYYDKSKNDFGIINIYLFSTPYNMIQTRFYDQDELFLNQRKIRLFEMRIDGLINFEIEDFLNRIINSENIIFIASDKKYIPLLNELKKEKKEIVIVCEKLNNGMRNHGFKWGDMAYPIGIVLGLNRWEL